MGTKIRLLSRASNPCLQQRVVHTSLDSARVGLGSMQTTLATQYVLFEIFNQEMEGKFVQMLASIESGSYWAPTITPISNCHCAHDCLRQQFHQLVSVIESSHN